MSRVFWLSLVLLSIFSFHKAKACENNCSSPLDKVALVGLTPTLLTDTGAFCLYAMHYSRARARNDKEMMKTCLGGMAVSGFGAGTLLFAMSRLYLSDTSPT